MEKSNSVQDVFSNNNNFKWKSFPYKITEIDEATNSHLLSDFTGEKTGFVQVGPKKWFFPSGYKQNAEIYYNFEARSDDVWIVTFPRSGTTWSQELVWLLSNNLDYETALQVPLEERFPFLEFSSFLHNEMKETFLQENSNSLENCKKIEEISTPVWQLLAKSTQRRFIKTHLPFQLLPSNLLEVGCKVNCVYTLLTTVLYVARNPKDVAVSFYHLNRLFRTQGYLGDFPKYWDYFERGLQPWTPYWEHIQEGWDRRSDPNLLFMFYEDMNQDLKGAISKISDFLGEKYSNRQIDSLVNHLKIDNFRNNKSVNMHLFKELGIINNDGEGFVRKGKSGDWTDYVDGLEDRADQWIAHNLQKTDLRFPL